MRNRNNTSRDMITQELVMRSKFPDFRCQKKKNSLVFTGTLRPGEISYEIRAEYIPSQHPKVFVLSPVIHPSSPHLWGDKSLCLVNPSVYPWRQCHLVAKLTIPWTALWLYFYEGWLETGIWYGPEFPHGDEEK